MHDERRGDAEALEQLERGRCVKGLCLVQLLGEGGERGLDVQEGGDDEVDCGREGGPRVEHRREEAARAGVGDGVRVQAHRAGRAVHERVQVLWLCEWGGIR